MFLRIFAPVFFATVLLGGLFYYIGTQRAMNEVIEAVKNRDLPALAERIDWDGLRAFLKEDIADKKARLGQQGASIGPSADRIDEIVDYYVQPENIALLYYYRDLWFRNIPEEAFIESRSYFPLFGYQMTLTYPDGAGVPGGAELVAMMRGNLRARAVFRLDGLTWRIRELHVPIFLVPRQSYTAPALQYFGRSVNPEDYYPDSNDTD